MNLLLNGGKYIKTNQLINFLNKVNFEDGSILVNFQHPKYDQIISLKAIPQPCDSAQVECIWKQKTEYCHEMATYRFLNFSLDDGLNFILAGADVQDVDENGIKLLLHDDDCTVTRRHVKRNFSQGIVVQLVQDSMVYRGQLLDFNSNAFSVEITFDQSQSADWINTDFEIYILFQKYNEVLYSGKCTIIEEVGNQYKKQLRLKPLINKIHRFKPKKTRSVRHTLSPSPNIVFEHPFTGQIVNLNVVDLSGTGLSVEEDPLAALLLPGMIIPDLRIELAGAPGLKCNAQIMYSNKLDETTLRCGLAILDMNPQDHIILSNLLYRVEENNTRFSSNGIDLDALWSFFFETGFIYPKKYALIESQKAQFKQLYKNLYTNNPDFARHIIYQEKGKILGHVSMLRYYEKTWVIQHHAAITSIRNKAGFVVMLLIGRYTNEFHHLKTSHMNYVACYFRPTSRFPDKVFGSVAREMKNPKRCSMDSFAYYCYAKQDSIKKLSDEWSLEPACRQDLEELERHYEHYSGGLMLDAMNLKPEMTGFEPTVDHEYKRMGYQRQQVCHALKLNNKLKGIFITLSTNVGLNMSDLTNCVHVIILDSERVTKDSLDYSLTFLIDKYYDQKSIPVLVNPVNFADDLQITYEKVYNLWIIDIQFADFYFQHVDSLLNRRKKRTISQ